MLLRRLLAPIPDAEPYIELLLQRYPSPALMLCCSENSLIDIGLPQRIASYLASLKPVLEQALVAEMKTSAVDSDPLALITYMQSLIGYNLEESFVVLHLDRSGGLISCDRYDGADGRGVFVQAKSIVRRCLDLRTWGVIIGQNYRGGSVSPSSNETFTRELEEKLRVFDIQLIDHMVVSKGKYGSILHNRGSAEDWKLLGMRV